MNYLKCVLARLRLLVMSVILIPLGFMTCLAIFVHEPKGQTMGFDVVSLVKSHVVWILAVFLFAVGYALEARRIASH
jgi:hypothetical protein